MHITHSYTPDHSQTQSPTQPQGRTGTYPERLRKSSRVTKSLSLTLNTHRQTKMQTHTTTKVHTWSHTHTYTESQSLSHTDRYRAIHSHTQGKTDAHSCTQAPGDTEQWAHCLDGQQLGKKEPSVDGGGRGVCYTTPTHTLSILSLFPLPEARFGWNLDLLRDSAPRCPLPSLLRCLVGDAWAPLWTSLPLGLWGLGVL